MVDLFGISAGHDLDMPCVELGARFDHIGLCPFDPTVSHHTEHNSRHDCDDGEKTPGFIADDAFKKEFDHDILPFSASVGLSFAIFLVGKKLTMVVMIRTITVVPTTRPTL